MHHREHPHGLHHCLVRQLYCLRPQDPEESGEDSGVHYRQQSSRPAGHLSVLLPENIYQSHCLKKIQKIRLDCSHPAYSLFTLLPSGKRYRSIQSRTNRLMNSFYPQVIRFLNKLLSGCTIKEEGCAALVSALKSNPSHLRELNLGRNEPGESGIKLLSDLLKDPHCKLEKL
ncbi:hypothetical protein NFI96_001088, partial [Prochilodus magdalenae]